jgi:hypothetical protein
MKIQTWVLISLIFLAQTSRAQESAPKFKIAIFAPLYLDSAFDDQSEYRYAKNIFPKFINPGLEFYEGAQLALDSLNKEKINLDVQVFDTRSVRQTVQQQLANASVKDINLLIAYCSANEVKSFADAGLQMNIPVINVNLPNDGGVTGNPFYVMLNSTLKTQCEGIYRHIQKFYALDRLIVFRKKGRSGGGFCPGGRQWPCLTLPRGGHSWGQGRRREPCLRRWRRRRILWRGQRVRGLLRCAR